MKRIAKETVEELLATCTGESFENWKSKRFSFVADEPLVDNKNSILKLIEENQVKSFTILQTFNRELTI